MTTIRASQLPILAACQGMLGQGYISVNVSNEAASEGTRIHAMVAYWANGGGLPDEDDQNYRDVARIAGLMGDDRVESSICVVEGELSGVLPEPSSIRLTGHPDYYDYDGDTARVIDIKTGWLSSGDGDDENIASKHIHQLAGYAWLICANHPRINRVEAVIIPRYGEPQREVWSRDQIYNWSVELAARTGAWDGRFNVGEHCQYCPRKFDCPGRQQILRSGVEALIGTGEPVVDLTTPEGMIRWWQVSGEVAKMAENVRESIRSNLDGDESKPIYLKPVSKTSIDPVNGWGVLEDELDQDALAGCVTIGKTKLEASLKAKVSTGKQAEVDRVFDRLKNAGAIKTEAGTPRVTINQSKEG